VNGVLGRRVIVAGLLVSLGASVALAQRGGRNRRPQLDVAVEGNTPYDGRFVFVRLKYATGFGRFGNWIGNGGLPWSHDYPEGEVHFSKILEELTLLKIRTNGSNILGIDDPELFNYPIAYMAEPGFWGVTEKEMVNLRSYLLKGGFLIFDDFRGEMGQSATADARRPPRGELDRARRKREGVSFLLRNRSSGGFAAPYGGLEATYWGCSKTTIRRRGSWRSRMSITTSVSTGKSRGAGSR
jgi:hypothetical protein